MIRKSTVVIGIAILACLAIFILLFISSVSASHTPTNQSDMREFRDFVTISTAVGTVTKNGYNLVRPYEFCPVPVTCGNNTIFIIYDNFEIAGSAASSDSVSYAFKVDNVAIASCNWGIVTPTGQTARAWASREIHCKRSPGFGAEVHNIEITATIGASGVNPVKTRQVSIEILQTDSTPIPPHDLKTADKHSLDDSTTTLSRIGSNTDSATDPSAASGTVFSKLRGIGVDTDTQSSQHTTLFNDHSFHHSNFLLFWAQFNSTGASNLTEDDVRNVTIESMEPIADSIDNSTAVTWAIVIFILLIWWAERTKDILIYIAAIMAGMTEIIVLWSMLNEFRFLFGVAVAILAIRAFVIAKAIWEEEY